MKQFMDKGFLLSADTAKTLYHDFAESTPILDYHCHINPQEVYRGRKFDTITQVWLDGDHYEWRQMRSNGVDEEYVTGDSTDREKFWAWVETMPKLIGNPLYHQSHLEPRKYFGYQGYLNGDTAKEVWNLCNTKLREDSTTVRNLIRQSGVALICTTGDPVDSLEWRKKIARDDAFNIQVLPVWRPDKTMNVEKPSSGTYMVQLSQVSGVQITDFASLKGALRKRTTFFVSMGCCVSDHALEHVMYMPVADFEVDAILAKDLKGEAVTKEEKLEFRTVFMLFVAREYNAMEWIMQIHYSCKRDNNGYMFKKLSAGTGFDCISNYAPGAQMANFLNTLSANNEIPKTILYSLNPNDNASTGTIIGCSQEKFPGKVQQGSAWWLNGHKTGMTKQMAPLANLGCPGSFIGVLIGSRSFLFCARHEYFRRMLCSLVGGWVESDEYPTDIEVLEEIVKGICYDNTVRYFGFKLDEVK